MKPFIILLFTLACGGAIAQDPEDRNEAPYFGLAEVMRMDLENGNVDFKDASAMFELRMKSLRFYSSESNSNFLSSLPKDDSSKMGNRVAGFLAFTDANQKTLILKSF